MKRTQLFFIFCMWVPMTVVGRSGNASSVSSSKISSVNIGALFTLNSVIGRSAKPAILAAVDDVNSDSSILPEIKLNVILRDTNCSGFLGTVEGTSRSYQYLQVDMVLSVLRMPYILS